MKKPILFTTLVLLFSVLNAQIKEYFPAYLSLDMELLRIEDELFHNTSSNTFEEDQVVSIDSILIIEEDEEVALHFNPLQYLPEGFNALAGKNDLDWSKIEIIEVEEEVDLGFDPEDFLPVDFNPDLNM